MSPVCTASRQPVGGSERGRQLGSELLLPGDAAIGEVDRGHFIDASTGSMRSSARRIAAIRSP